MNNTMAFMHQAPVIFWALLCQISLDLISSSIFLTKCQFTHQKTHDARPTLLVLDSLLGVAGQKTYRGLCPARSKPKSNSVTLSPTMDREIFLVRLFDIVLGGRVHAT